MLMIQHFPKGCRVKGHFILSCRMTFEQATNKVADLKKWFIWLITDCTEVQLYMTHAICFHLQRWKGFEF